MTSMDGRYLERCNIFEFVSCDEFVDEFLMLLLASLFRVTIQVSILMRNLLKG